MFYSLRSEDTVITLNTLGGELNSVIHKDVEYLWQGDTNFWAGRAPVCFPINGSLREGTAVALGKRCQMPRHGVARTEEFKVLEVTEQSITFSLTANETTILQYPFHFELQIKYTLQGNTIINEYTVINHGGVALPFAVGGHPAFNCPLIGGESFNDYYLEFPEIEDAQCLRPNERTGLVDVTERFEGLSHTNKLELFHFLFNKDALIFDTLRSKSVSLRSTKTPRGLTLDFSDFNYLLLWSSKGETPFIAIEPWTGISTCSDEDDVLENKRGMTLLDSMQSTTIRFAITAF